MTPKNQAAAKNQNHARGFLTILDLMNDNKIRPNFFCSVPYLHYSGAVARVRSDAAWVEADDVCLFPPMPINGVFKKDYPVNEIWSDYAGFEPPGDRWLKTFLDWEYLYNPHDFQTMRGGRWETFRKNSRKWPKFQRNVHYGRVTQGKEERWNLVAEWLEKRQASVLDPETIVSYVMNPVNGVYQKALTRNGQLVGLNIWDENYCYVNFRFCIVRAGERYLDEYMRRLFYTDPEILAKGKLVNDGGVLDNEGLQRFKDKMNPVRKRKMYGWKRK